MKNVCEMTVSASNAKRFVRTLLKTWSADAKSAANTSRTGAASATPNTTRRTLRSRSSCGSSRHWMSLSRSTKPPKMLEAVAVMTPRMRSKGYHVVISSPCRLAAARASAPMSAIVSNAASVAASRRRKASPSSNAVIASHAVSGPCWTRCRRTSQAPAPTSAVVPKATFRPQGIARNSESPTTPPTVPAAAISSPSFVRGARTGTTVILPPASVSRRSGGRESGIRGSRPPAAARRNRATCVR